MTVDSNLTVSISLMQH